MLRRAIKLLQRGGLNPKLKISCMQFFSIDQAAEHTDATQVCYLCSLGRNSQSNHCAIGVFQSIWHYQRHFNNQIKTIIKLTSNIFHVFENNLHVLIRKLKWRLLPITLKLLFHHLVELIYTVRQLLPITRV